MSSSSWRTRTSRGNPQALPRPSNMRASRIQPRELTDTGRRILLKTSRRSALLNNRPQLSDETRYIERRYTTQGLGGGAMREMLPNMYKSVFGNQAHPQAFFQSRAGLVFMTASWLSVLSYLYENTDSKSWMYPLLHSIDGLESLSPPVYYATTTALLLANSYITAYAAEIAGRYLGKMMERTAERMTGVRNSQFWINRKVPVTEPTHAPEQQPNDPYAAFQRPLYSTAMPLQGPTMDSMKPGRFLRSNVGLVFLTILWFGFVAHLYRTTDGSRWYYSLLHALDGLDQLSTPAYYIAVASLILAHSYATAYFADRLAFALSDTVDVAVQKVEDVVESVRGIRGPPKASTPEVDGYASADIPRVFRGNFGIRVR